MPNKPKDEIKVFVTKTGHFRAKVKLLPGKVPERHRRFAVTVGGQRWDDHERLTVANRVRIVDKCERLLNKLKLELEGL